MAGEPIQIRGLREFNRSLKQLDADMPKAVRLALNEAVALVVEPARAKVATRSGAARRSVRAKSTRTKARIAGGGRRVPYYPWLDFGGRVGAQRQVKRPFYKQGRYLWKAYADNRAELLDSMGKVLTKVATDAGFEVS